MKKPIPKKPAPPATQKQAPKPIVPSEISKGEARRATPPKTTTTMTQASAKSTGRNPVFPKTTKNTPAKPVKKPAKMTPQDAAMKKILEKKYGKIYG